MHINTFDRYKIGESLVHFLDPRVKVVVTVLFILSNVLLPDGACLAFVLAWGLTLLTSALAGLGLGYALKHSFVALPFALAAITVVFNLPGQPLLAWKIGRWQLVATDAGLIRFASIVVRTWLSVQMAILLTATTRFPDLLHALHHLHVPQLMVAIISFMYRYLFVLTDEAKDFLIEKGYDPDFGARPLKRTIERYIEDPLAEELLRGGFKGTSTINVTVRNDHLYFDSGDMVGSGVSSEKKETPDQA